MGLPWGGYPRELRGILGLSWGYPEGAILGGYSGYPGVILGGISWGADILRGTLGISWGYSGVRQVAICQAAGKTVYIAAICQVAQRVLAESSLLGVPKTILDDGLGWWEGTTGRPQPVELQRIPEESLRPDLGYV